MPVSWMNDGQMANLAKLLDVSSFRAKVHAANLANQNTPGYKAKAVAFEEAFLEALDSGRPVDGLQPTVFEPGETMVQPDGNDVSTDRETMLMAQSQSLYNAYLALATGKRKLLSIALSPAPGG